MDECTLLVPFADACASGWTVVAAVSVASLLLWCGIMGCMNGCRVRRRTPLASNDGGDDSEQQADDSEHSEQQQAHSEAHSEARQVRWTPAELQSASGARLRGDLPLYITQEYRSGARQ